MYMPIKAKIPPKSITSPPAACASKLPTFKIYLNEKIDEPIASARTPKQAKRQGLLIIPPLKMDNNLKAKYARQTFTAKATTFRITWNNSISNPSLKSAYTGLTN